MENSENLDVSNDLENGMSDLLNIITTISDSSTDTSEPSLLTTLKPYLSKKRQKKLEQCERILTLSNTLKILNDLHIFDNTEET